MQLVSYADGRPGRLVGDHVLPIPHVASMRELITRWDELRPAIPDSGEGIGLSEVRLRAPIPHPSKIIAAPVNYHDHMAEMNVDATIDALGFFLKAPSSVLDPGGTVQLPYHDRRFDYEGELAVVIGRTARHLAEEEALGHVFGYTGLLDITMRGGEDRSLRKSFETFTPMGPVLVSADEFGDPADVELRLRVNGEVRQKANTGDLIWGVAQLVSYASWVTTLHPGDVIATGTPAGVGPIHPGDTVRLELSRLGHDLVVGVAADHTTASHTAGHGRGPVPPPPQPRRDGQGRAKPDHGFGEGRQ